MNGRAKWAGIAVITVLPVFTGIAVADDFAGYSGRQLYDRFCASCHGADGQGDGPVATTFEVLLPDLTHISRRSGGTFPEERVRRVIDGRTVLRAHGTALMPVWGYEFNTGEAAGSQLGDPSVLLDRLVGFLRDIQR